MSHIQISWYAVAMCLCTLLSHGCQQPQLTVVGDEPTQKSPPASQELTPKYERSMEATKEHEPSGIVLTSSSDSSPDTRHADPAAPDRNSQDQLMANASQGNTLTYARADTTITEANDKEVARKRPATTQLDKIEEQRAVAKQAKIEAPSPAHKAWFASFTQAAAQIGEDPQDEAAWENMERILDEGKQNNLLAASIMYPNDSNPAATYEYTPLHYAAARGILELVRELVERRSVSVDIQTKDSKNTPLHLASSRGHLDVVQFLEKHGANLNLVDNEEGSALHYAAAGRKGEMNREVIEYLIAKGADFKKTIDSGTAMLGIAVIAGNMPVVEYWEDNYSNSSDPDIDIITNKALMLAKYRLKQFPQEQGTQAQIIKILTNFLKTRQDKGVNTAK